MENLAGIQPRKRNRTLDVEFGPEGGRCKQERFPVRKALICSAAFAAILTLPALAADTDQLQKHGTQQYQPGTGGQSKAGQNGLPGNKSGKAAPRANSGAERGESGMAAPDSGNAAG